MGLDGLAVGLYGGLAIGGCERILDREVARG
jgi:hypothetical protein